MPRVNQPPASIPKKNTDETKPSASGQWRTRNTQSSPPNTEITSSDSETDSDYESGPGTPLLSRLTDFPPDLSESPSFPVSPLNDSATLNRTLGKGRFASVTLIEQKSPAGTERYALKIPLRKLDCENEARILAIAGQHPNLPRSFGIQEVEGKKGLLLEYVKGPDLWILISTLTEQFEDQSISSEAFFNAVAFLQQQQLQTLEHLEQKKIVHADIKPSNIIYDADSGKLKLLDFGQSALTSESVCCGHENYAAPEAFESLQGSEKAVPATTAIDCFAAGQSLYRILSGIGRDFPTTFTNNSPEGDFTPGQRNEQANLVYQAMKDYMKPNADNSYKKALPIDSQYLDHQALFAASASHPKVTQFEDLVEPAGKLKPYLAPCIDLINSLLHPRPDLRMTATQALQHPWFKQCLTDTRQAEKTIKAVLTKSTGYQ